MSLYLHSARQVYVQAWSGHLIYDILQNIVHLIVEKSYCILRLRAQMADALSQLWGGIT